MANGNEVAATNEHLRAICDEVGYRLGLILDQAPIDPSPRLQALLLPLEDATYIKSPSIVPDIVHSERSKSPVAGD